MMLRAFVFILFITLGISSCSDNAVFDRYKTLPNYWAANDTISFSLEELDTISSYNAFINLRNNKDYSYSNIFLITAMHFPNGKVVTDTLEYDMAYPNGNYLGQGFGDVKESKLWYKEGIVFAESGRYTLQITQAMRSNGSETPIEKLEGLTEVGFRLEPTSKK